LTRALHSTAVRLLGGRANSAANIFVNATKGGKATSSRDATVDPAEERLLLELEDLAQKAFVLSEFADAQLLLSTGQKPPQDSTGHTPLSPHIAHRRRASSGSATSENLTLREQEVAAAEAMVLYVKSMAFLQAGMESAKRYWNAKSANRDQFDTTLELNDSEC
jgi:serine/threonine-protein kinase ULK/ATG1